MQTSKSKRLVAGLGLWTCVLLTNACPAPKKPEPSGAYMKVRPQRIAVVVAEPCRGDALELRLGELLREELAKQGFEAVAGGDRADAELRYLVDERVAVRAKDGRRMVSLGASAELVSDMGILWKKSGFGGDDCDERKNLRGITLPPDYEGEPVPLTDAEVEELVESAAASLARSMISHFPDRVAPRAERLP